MSCPRKELTAFLLLLSLISCFGENINLNDGWTVSCADSDIEVLNQTLPSGVYSVLEAANITESIQLSFNDVDLRWIANKAWNYRKYFDVPSNIIGITNIFLVFHGVDTVATIKLNNQTLGSVDNMFVRHRFNVNELIKPTSNFIDVELLPPALEAKKRVNNSDPIPPECPPLMYNGECHMNMIRKMQSSFAWDWGLAAPSMGIWKPVVLEVYESAIIRDVVINLIEDKDSWTIYMNISFEREASNVDLHGNIYMDLIGVLETPIKEEVVLEATENVEQMHSTSISIPKDKIELWWPNGYGSQKIYILNVRWDGSPSLTQTNEIPRIGSAFFQSEKEIKIGFRTIELIQEELTDHGLSFYFKVNHVPIFMKGSNWIPMEILPEKQFNYGKMKMLLTAAKESHMNMLRVWGGGVYESDDFYQLADQYGILIWQDMMFACAMYPVNEEFLLSVADEIQQNIRRIQHHPSIAIWAANNENEVALRQNWYNTNGHFDKFAGEYIRLYVDTIKVAVNENDNWHPFVTSSPSNGKLSEQQNYVADDPQNWHYGDVHYYNYLSDGWDPNIYPKPRFASEYGFQSIPSMSNWQSVLKDNDNLTKLVIHRQHSPLGNTPMIRLISKHLPLPNKNHVDFLETLIYFSQISQAMVIKQETESYRVGRGNAVNTMGALYWQLNDVWVAPSWSSIEYDGTFKILQHWAKTFFAPKYIVAHPDPSGLVTITAIRDGFGEVEQYTVVVNVFQWDNITPIRKEMILVELEPNSVKTVANFNLSDHFPIRSSLNLERFIRVDMLDSKNVMIASNYVFPANLKKCIGIQNPKLEFSVLDKCNSAGYSRVSIDIRIQKPALFVYIQIKKEALSKFKISDNGFMQINSIKTVYVEYYNPGCLTTLTEKDFKIMTVNDFMQK